MKADDTFQQKSMGPTTFLYIKFFRRNLAFDTRNVVSITDIHVEVVKKRHYPTKKPYSRSIGGASLEVI
uniref:Uncharacterized protein n=1 Tax=Zea mays TaxID=4577 RepID=A0A804PBG9_MAIZE